VTLELEWVLRGYYGFAVESVLQVFEQLLSHPCLSVEDRPDLEQALAGVRAGLDFADALHHASCRNCAVIASFDDRGFARRIRQLNLPPPVVMPTAR
jgi:predicted nucleic-acid-binding protein